MILALELACGLLGLLVGADLAIRGASAIGYRFGLREIELVVEVGTAAEFAGFGKSGTEFDDTPKQQIHDNGTAMSLKFEHVLAGKRRRRRKIQRNALIKRRAGGVPKMTLPTASTAMSLVDNP